MENSPNNDLLEKLEIVENGIDINGETFVQTRIVDFNDYLKLLGEVRRKGAEGHPGVVEKPDLFARGIGVIKKDDDGNKVFWIRKKVVNQVEGMLRVA
ncbi:hypothetical protein K9M41_01180 [Candidatus Gracilibacteria bacterium]|nr:hypothetical protein [Candidatus Gracilibacteria bacterium]